MARPPTSRTAAALLAVALAGGLALTPQIAAAAPAPPLSAAPGSTAAVDTAGPDALRAGPVDAPQLQNTGIWHAAPIGICHTSAYLSGEYVHQGCIYDDEGGGNQYRWPVDTLARNYTYPEDPAYRRNAADILEVRVEPQAAATAFRITMNTMTDPELLGLTLALGDGPKTTAPHGTNTLMPARVFVTVHGSTGDIIDAATGSPLAATPTVTVDLPRRQIQVLVPHAAVEPTGVTSFPVRAAAGLWARGTDHYLVPGTTATQSTPGGAQVGDPTPSVFFDSAFRFTEPFEAPYRNGLQRSVIAAGDLTPFVAKVDFTKLAAGAVDTSGVPTTGYQTRVFATSSEKAQGRRLPGDPGGPPPGSGTQQGGLQTGTGTGSTGGPSLQFGWVCRDTCVADLPGRMQRYMVYVPTQPAPAAGYASMVWTNGYALRPEDDVAGSKDLFRSFADRPGRPTMVIDVDARGNDEWFYGDSGATVFEALADARRHYPLDVDKTAAGGFSSGAYGANKLSLQFPDVFSSAFICDGLDKAASFPGVNGVADVLPIDTVTQHAKGSEISAMLPNRRNQPVMEWAGVNDDFIPYPITRKRANEYAAGDYDYEFISWTGLAAEHLVMCKNGMWDLATTWMGDRTRVVNPQHVSFVRNPLMDDPGAGLVSDHAYWLSSVSTRHQALGLVDVTTEGLGRKDPVRSTRVTGLGIQTGTVSPLNPYVREARSRAAAPIAPVADVLHLTTANITALTIDPVRAGVSCNATITGNTDGAVSVTLLGCGAPRVVGAGAGAPAPAEALSLPSLPGGLLDGLPLPAELGGQVPNLPVAGLPPLRFPPNQENPTP